MKTLITCLAIVLACFTLKAQGDLQFNQVINTTYTMSVTGSSGGNPGFLTNTYTINVPAGKVWKLESVKVAYAPSNNPTFFNFPAGSSFSHSLSMDGGVLSTGSDWFEGPIWLKEGAHTIYFTGTAYNTSIAHIYTAFFSYIEFNITP
ncbi:MAG: hypothetical protein SFW35_05620 [Chitinophagales bacterium]|nr:hypothetical protein [Chitinophagales bacterium]